MTVIVDVDFQVVNKLLDSEPIIKYEVLTI